MANVLPKKSLTAARRFYRARFVFVGSLVAVVSGTITLLALMPAYATVRGEHAGENDLATVSLPPSTDRDDVLRAQALVKGLESAASSTASGVDILGEVLAIRPAGVKVSNISYKPGESGTIILSGTAPSRDGINAYRAVLAKDPRFKNVSVPLGTLAGSGGGQFSITLTGAF